MNLAFPALLTFLLILPGFIFRAAYTRSERTQLDNRPFTSETVKSLILATLLHTLWLWAAKALFSVKLDYQGFLTIYTSAHGALLDGTINSAAHHMPQIIFYLMSLYICAYLMGRSLQKLVLRLKLDRHPLLSDLFRFDTPWFYLFKGYNEEGEEAHFVKLAVTINQGGATYLYYGILEDFFLTDAGHLDRLVLSSVVRRRLEADEEDAEQARFYEIAGDRFVLKYTDITSLNIEYYKIIDNEGYDPSLEARS
ncbi:MAG: hypothetical protein ABW068_10230 [Candidatus Thiodiazotropha sp.]